ncbi:DUF3347 domain-containing protein [Paraflavisolibacter sp. H34]|uniref:DUF3347 domain-containing protein n=1 Tax=Huijunlia imazamoxiresistens TaxID=3127457 RepID=UPI003015D628
MKTFLMISLAAAALGFTACNSNSGTSNKAAPGSADTAGTPTALDTADQAVTAPTGEVIAAYLKIKNALADDNGKSAAVAGTDLAVVIGNVAIPALKEEQKKVFAEVQQDMKEHAEHIGANGGNIHHQREHFETLSQEVYELARAGGTGGTLYLDFCPMYNKNKGAGWVSETKEIRNPYLGKEMLTCGTVKEEIR